MDQQTEFEFTLPRGFQPQDGSVHRSGVMRLATAKDEIETAGNPRLQANPSYLPVLLLSRVIVRLGSLEVVTPQVIENLFVSDFTYLEDLYQRINQSRPVILGTTCPHCGNAFHLQVAPLTEMEAASL